jgi:hypothetical protein
MNKKMNTKINIKMNKITKPRHEYYNSPHILKVI